MRVQKSRFTDLLEAGEIIMTTKIVWFFFIALNLLIWSGLISFVAYLAESFS